MEYALSTAIKKISIDDKPVVGFVTGHGEPSLAEMSQANDQLTVLYETREIPLNDTTAIPENISTLALIRPTDSIPERHLQQMDAFLKRGGRILVAMNSVEADFRTRFGSAQNNNLKPWLRNKGIDVLDNFIVDAQCGSVSVPQQLGIFTVQANISFPYIPLISTFADHSITSGLEMVMLEFASEIRFTGDSTKTFYPLAFSSRQSNGLPAPQFFDIEREWSEVDFPRQHIPVAAAIEGNPMKMVVIADGDFPVNGPPQQARNLQPDNVSLLSNAIDWLSDDTGLIALRTKGVVSRPLDEVDEATKNILKYTNFLLPILLVIGYGLLGSGAGGLADARPERSVADDDVVGDRRRDAIADDAAAVRPGVGADCAVQEIQSATVDEDAAALLLRVVAGEARAGDAPALRDRPALAGWHIRHRDWRPVPC
jgi:hypothetical protein